MLIFPYLIKLYFDPYTTEISQREKKQRKIDYAIKFYILLLQNNIHRVGKKHFLRWFQRSGKEIKWYRKEKLYKLLLNKTGVVTLQTG